MCKITLLQFITLIIIKLKLLSTWVDHFVLKAERQSKRQEHEKGDFVNQKLMK